MYNTTCIHCGLRACVCGYMYRGWSKEELEGAINTMQNILAHPMKENPQLLSLEDPLERTPCNGDIIFDFGRELSIWERWKLRKKRKSLETLWKGAEFRFRPDCPLVRTGDCTELQGVVEVHSWDIDGYGNYCYTITSRGLDGKVITFGTSTYDRTGGPHPDVHPKYILIRG